MKIDTTIRTVTPADISPLLTQINDPPVTLRIQGAFPGLPSSAETYKYLTVVGSRKYSEYGKAVCESLIEGLAGYPVVIISGLALGTDSIAHRAALHAGLKTVAVPGSGLGERFLYPASHRGLRDNILESGGCLLSEFDDSFRATLYSFPQRNRIMAGLAHAVLVIEAELQSGTLITSKYATEYNRDVFTIPHSIFNKTGEGPHMLLRLGARLITNVEDILDAFDLLPHEGLFGQSEKDEFRKAARNYSTCSTDEMEIITLLSTRPRNRDEIIECMENPVYETQAILSILEIKGMIKEEMGEVRLV